MSTKKAIGDSFAAIFILLISQLIVTEKQKKDKREKLSPLLISASDTDFSPSKMQKRHRPPICLHFSCFEKS